MRRLAGASSLISIPASGRCGMRWDCATYSSGHDAHVTIAENIGQPSCGIPTCGLDWITTRQPVVLNQWPAVGSDAASRPITSVVSWRGAYGPVTYAGHTYGLRAREFRKFATLPVALRGSFSSWRSIFMPATRRMELLAPTAGRWSHRRRGGRSLAIPAYIGQSAAELMIAKGMYVDTHSGWSATAASATSPAGSRSWRRTRSCQPAADDEGLVTFRPARRRSTPSARSGESPGAIARGAPPGRNAFRILAGTRCTGPQARPQLIAWRPSSCPGRSPTNRPMAGRRGPAVVGPGFQAARLRRVLPRADRAVHLRRRQRLDVRGRAFGEPDLLRRGDEALRTRRGARRRGRDTAVSARRGRHCRISRRLPTCS